MSSGVGLACITYRQRGVKGEREGTNLAVEEGCDPDLVTPDRGSDSLKGHSWSCARVSTTIRCMATRPREEKEGGLTLCVLGLEEGLVEGREGGGDGCHGEF
jgi:hypothetical protein